VRNPDASIFMLVCSAIAEPVDVRRGGEFTKKKIGIVSNGE